MAKMGRYCKAYTLGALRKFGGWTDKRESASSERAQPEEKQAKANPEFTDSDIVYVQENVVVTDGIFIDEGVIFDQVTPEWVEFCKNDLKFEVPVFEASVSTSS